MTHSATKPAPARFATPRDPKWGTIGPRIALVSTALGKVPMHHQQQVFDVAGERDSFGRFRYEIVLVTLPRQSGKTTLVAPVQLDRIITQPDIKVFYTAQTGQAARSRFGDLVKLVQRSPLEEVAKFRYSAGDEGVTFPNASTLKVFAPTEAAIHGETPPLVTLDEIWEYDEALGDAMLEGAILPAQITLGGNKQVWMVSTAGTALSKFMRKWVDRGRAQVEAQRRGEVGEWPRMAYFEWSMDPSADPYDPDVIRGFHPAADITQPVEDLLQMAKTTSRATWLRAFCNVWTEAANPVMSFEDWDALAADPAKAAIPTRDQIAITYEASFDNETGAVMATWIDDAGVIWTRVLHAAPGVHWMVDLLENIYREWKPLIMGADDGGPTRVITDELRRRLRDDDKTKIRTLGPRDFGVACETVLAAMRDSKTFRQDGSKTLRHAIAHLALKRVNDSMRFSRKDSTGPIAGLIAAAVGAYLFTHRDTSSGEAELYF